MTWNLIWISNMGNHGELGVFSEHRRSSCSSLTCDAGLWEGYIHASWILLWWSLINCLYVWKSCVEWSATTVNLTQMMPVDIIEITIFFVLEARWEKGFGRLSPKVHEFVKIHMKFKKKKSLILEAPGKSLKTWLTAVPVWHRVITGYVVACCSHNDIGQ